MTSRSWQGWACFGHRSKAVSLALLCATAAVMACASVSAQAEVTHSYLSQITEIPASSGAPLTGPLSGVNGMTVDAGDLWVAEHVEGTDDESRVDEFDEAGDFLSQLPQVPGIGDTDSGIAAGNGAFGSQVYVAANETNGPGAGVVAVFNAANGDFMNAWKGEDTPQGSFGVATPDSVAFDGSSRAGDWAKGDVYVSAPTQGAIDVFKPEAEGKEVYVTQITGPSSSEPGELFPSIGQLAVDQSNGDLIVAGGALSGGVVDVLEPVGLDEVRLALQLTHSPHGAFTLLSGVAVDSGTGEIYVGSSSENAVDEFSDTGTYVGRVIGTPEGDFHNIRSIAVDATSHHLYVGDYRQNETLGQIDAFGPDIIVPTAVTGPTEPSREHTVTLTGVVEPEGAGDAECEFDWGTTPALGQVTACSAPIGNSSGSVPVQASLTGLESGTKYYYTLTASNSKGTDAGEAEVLSVTTAGPAMGGAWASKVASTSATLEASIDPRDTPTSYYFEYGSSSTYEADAPILTAGAPRGALIGSGEVPMRVSQPLVDRSPGESYHYRVVAISEVAPGEFERSEGPDQTFTTQGAGSAAGLPDGRVWEMVSPPDKQGALIPAVENEDVVQAAADGSAVTYRTMTPIEAEPQGYTFYFSQALSVRGPGGWSSRDITTRREAGIEGLDGGEGYEYKLFSPNLGLAVVEPYGPFTPLSGEEASPHASERTQYIRSNQTCQATPATCYTPLVTAANTPPGTAIEGSNYFHGETSFAGATPDLSHVVIRSQVPLAEVPGSTGGLYEWADGELQLISVLPESEGEGPASTDVFLGYGTDEHNVARDAISADGSHIVWTEALDDHLYDRDTVTHKTVRLDLPQGGDGSGAEGAMFQAATSDGSRVFFTDTQRLTVAASASGNDLYMCEVAELAGAPTCHLTDLTPDPHPGEATDVEGVLPGVSEADGNYVYFVAAGALAAGATPGGHNLYMEHEEDGVWTTTFIAGLGAGDVTDWSGGGVEKLTGQTAMVSPNGERLAFMSAEPLTGYDNHDANPEAKGARDQEVYLYSAATRQLVCASCNPTGARPRGVALDAAVGTAVPLLVEGDVPWQAGTWAAATIPGWTPLSLQEGLYQPRYLSNTGRLFFDSDDALVPQDGNGTEDVYEYEPPSKGSEGEGNCTTSTEGATDVYSPQAQGCIGLVSSGTSSEESVFLDASEGGGDVFFLTSERLAPQDVDGSYDVYDAHECTALSPCQAAATEAPPPCASSDACKSAPAPQPGIFGASGSATFSGAGNTTPTPASSVKVKTKSLTRPQKLAKALKACKKRTKKKRAACERQARRAYGPVRKAKKSPAATRRGK